MKYGLIYKYENKSNHRIYIGKTIQNFKRRRHDHLIQNGKDDFHQDLIKMGENGFEIEILEDNIKEDILSEREYYWYSYYKNEMKKEMYNTYDPPHKIKDGKETKAIRKYAHSTIIKDLPKTAVPIENSKNYWIDIDGSIYSRDYRFGRKGQLIKRTMQENFGYTICSILDNNGHKKWRRVNRIVAEAFIPNPDNLPVVGHKNNIKNDNRVENLYWTTFSENTQKAVDDKLLKNDKGIEDSQSKPVNMYETCSNKLLKSFGSISEAVRETGLSKTTIARQAKYKRPTRRDYYFRYIDDEDCKTVFIGQINYDTEEIINTFVNFSQASVKTGVPAKTINQQCKVGKPQIKYRDFYFKYIDIDKCEQTIES